MESERYQRGLDILNQVDAAAGQKTIAAVADIAPDFARLMVEFAFGDLYARPGLDLRSRQIAAVAALSALGHAAPQLEGHIHGALNAGLSRQEVVEIIMQVAVHAGFPASLSSLQAAKRVFAQRDQEGKNP